MSHAPWLIRPAGAEDFEFLVCMLGQAVAWQAGDSAPSHDVVLATPGLAHYIDAWPRAGDHAVIASDESPVGAAWWRRFSAEDPGYGYVADDIPELAIGVRPASRGRGVGTALLATLIVQAEAQGLRGLSLSVNQRNPAIHLYERLGFAPVGTNGDSKTMMLQL